MAEFFQGPQLIASLTQALLVERVNLENLSRLNNLEVVCQSLAAVANNPGYSADYGQRKLNARLHQLSGLKLLPKDYSVAKIGESIFFLVPHQDPEAAGTVVLPETARPPFVCFPKNNNLVFAVPAENRQSVSYLSVYPYTINGLFQTALRAIFEPGNPAEDYVAVAFQAATNALHASPITV